ncbi:MAG: cation:proton antiporter [Christensenellaceae bacterium]|nr:cation:proton antiporter [Christensenellaceae bacterium]
MNTLLALAIAIGVGLLFTRFINLIKLPHVTAYLIAGLVIGPYGLNVLTTDLNASLAILSDVALGFIAYSIGAEFKLSYLKEIGMKPIVITAFEGCTASLCVFVTLCLLGQPMPLCLALGAIAAATAPAATLMVVRQYRAHGPVTKMLLPVVAMDDALGLMLYAIMMAIARTIISGAELSAMTLLVKPLMEIGGSLLLGLLLGLCLVLVLRFFHSRGNKLALTLMFVFLAVGLSSLWGLSSLLVCMMLGAAMVNLYHQSNVMLEQCDRFTPPLFLIFFVLSGANLDLAVLPTVGVVGIAYVLSRAVGKTLGGTMGAAVERCDRNIVRYLGLTLIPQAGVAIGMARMSATALPEYSAVINAVVLSGTLIYELTGPVITKIALTKAGEIKAEPKKAKKAATV